MAEHAFHVQFGLPVGVDRALWEILGHRHLLGHAISRAGAGKDHLADLLSEHRIEQLFRPVDVMLVITLRLAHGFADIGEAREMDDDLDGLLAQHQADVRFIGHVEPHERHARRDGGRMPLGKVVQHHDAVAGSHSLPDAMTADVAGAAHHEHVHGAR